MVYGANLVITKTQLERCGQGSTMSMWTKHGNIQWSIFNGHTIFFGKQTYYKYVWQRDNESKVAFIFIYFCLILSTSYLFFFLFLLIKFKNIFSLFSFVCMAILVEDKWVQNFVVFNFIHFFAMFLFQCMENFQKKIHCLINMTTCKRS